MPAEGDAIFLIETCCLNYASKVVRALEHFCSRAAGKETFAITASNELRKLFVGFLETPCGFGRLFELDAFPGLIRGLRGICTFDEAHLLRLPRGYSSFDNSIEYFRKAITSLASHEEQQLLYVLQFAPQFFLM